MATPVLITASPALTVGQGERFVLTATNLNSSEAVTGLWDIILTVLPVGGTLYNRSVPVTAVPYSFTQANINDGDIVYENNGLTGIVADGFTFKLSDREPTLNQTSTASMVITVNSANNGWLVTMTSADSRTSLLRFSRMMNATAYYDAWRLFHVGTAVLLEIDTAVTTWNFVPLNQNDILYDLTDPDEFLDSVAVKNIATLIRPMLLVKRPEITTLIRTYGRLLETTESRHIKLLATAPKADWEFVRAYAMTQLQSRYHNWIATLDLLRAQLQ